MRRTCIGLMGLLLGCVALWPARAAQASCVLPELKLVWSYPADGQTDVPTNAHVFFLTTLVGIPSEITINGVAPPAETVTDPPTYGYAPVLAPDTQYRVALKYTNSTNELSFSFTTGAGPAASGPPAGPAIRGVTATPARDLSPMCAAAVSAMDCFDTGQDTHLIFDTDAKPVLFFVTGPEIPWAMLWPGECGAPEIFVGECSGKHTIYAVSATGEASTQDVGCSTTAGPGGPGAKPATGDGGSGCSVAPGSGGNGLSDTLSIVAVAIGLLVSSSRRRLPRVAR